MRPLTVLALIAGLALGAGCGSDGTIPENDAQSLRERLDTVRAAIEAGDCSKAEGEIDIVRERVQGLDAPVRLRRNLREGVDKLDDATNRDCEETPEEEPTDTTTVETTTVTVPTTTATTTTAPPTTTTAPTTPTTPTVPEDTTTIEPPTGGVPPADEQGDEGDFG